MPSGPRAVWRLVSPASELLVCDVVRDGEQFELRVTRGRTALLTYPGASLAALHGVAAEWRAGLCARGYAPAPDSNEEEFHQSLPSSGDPSPDRASASNPLGEDWPWQSRPARRT